MIVILVMIVTVKKLRSIINEVLRSRAEILDDEIQLGMSKEEFDDMPWRERRNFLRRLGFKKWKREKQRKREYYRGVGDVINVSELEIDDKDAYDRGYYE